MADDPGNPGGYRPDDPRYGLSGAALEEYYRSRPTQFLIHCAYKPDSLHLREAGREAHLAHVRAHADKIHFAGPLWNDAGTTPIGTMTIIELPDRAAAEAYAAGDGYTKAGLLEPPQITRFVSSKRLKQNDRAPDPDQQMFMCVCLDGPDAARIRPTTAADHHAYQGSVIDRYIAHGPLRTDDGAGLLGSLFIIEVADRAAAEELVNNEPMTKGGVFEKVEITRWRYGKSIS